MLAARAPNATLAVLPGGHWLMYQDPGGLARAAEEWLK
jgi:pimeloyl-ACP methyl ester carboxylesterase